MEVDSPSTPNESPPSGATDLRTVQRAALERGVLDADQTRHHLAFAAALEPARASTPDGTERGHDALAVALVAVSATTVLADAPSPVATAPSPPRPAFDLWRPDTEHVPETLVVDGAALACQLLDVSPERAATLAAVSPTAVREALDRASAES